MTDDNDTPTEQLPDEPDEHEGEPIKPLPMLLCQGEGYITRADGTRVNFTIQGEG